jgi:hypothetical protein
MFDLIHDAFTRFQKRYVFLLTITLVLSACGSGGGGGDSQSPGSSSGGSGNTPQVQSDWDDMNWDEGSWR